MKFDQLILRKFIKIVATSWDFKAKMHQIWFRMGHCPRRHWVSLQRFPRPFSLISGGLLVRGGVGEGRRKGKGRKEGVCVCVLFALCLRSYVRLLHCRIDRSHWNPFVSLVNKVDSHVLENAYKRSNWKKMTPLLAALHGNSSLNYAWSLNYHQTFTLLLDKQER